MGDEPASKDTPSWLPEMGIERSLLYFVLGISGLLLLLASVLGISADGKNTVDADRQVLSPVSTSDGRSRSATGNRSPQVLRPEETETIDLGVEPGTDAQQTD